MQKIENKLEELKKTKEEANISNDFELEGDALDDDELLQSTEPSVTSVGTHHCIVTENQIGIRIDKYLSDQFSDQSRSYLQKLVKDGQVLVSLDIKAQSIPLDILYEDEDILIINKPKDMVVHPSAGHLTGTLVNGIMYHCKENLSGINGVLRPGIVHRIDKDTTGVLVVCKNDMAHAHISEQLKVHSITRKYNAIVYHNFTEDEGTVDAPIGRHPIDRKKMAVNERNGKHAVTHYRVLERLKGNRFTLVECQLETGRTHQIRVHMAKIQHPLLGDTTYGPKNQPYKLQGQCLHARVLGFIHPRTGKYMEFEAPLPDYFQKLLEELR